MFKREPLWVQFHNLPLGMMNQVYGEKLGRTVGDVKGIDVDTNGLGWAPYLRIKIWIDITKSLLKGGLISHEGKQFLTSFMYERLPNFCFRCCIIKHPTFGYPKEGSINKIHENDHYQYGAWLRASSLKPHKKVNSQNSDKKSQFSSSSIGKNA